MATTTGEPAQNGDVTTKGPEESGGVSTTTIAIAVAIPVGVILLLTCVTCLICKKRRKPSDSAVDSNVVQCDNTANMYR